MSSFFFKVYKLKAQMDEAQELIEQLRREKKSLEGAYERKRRLFSLPISLFERK